MRRSSTHDDLGILNEDAKLFDTAFSCSEIYGRMPMAAIIVDEAAQQRALP
jgi:hypothetical protein